MTHDSEAPLTRIHGESAKANDALRDYWLMGSGRSLRGLLADYVQRTTNVPPTKKWTTLSTWSTRYHWQARIAAQKEIEDAKMLAVWEERRLLTREQDWSQSERLRDIANKIMDEAPKFTTAKRQFVPGRNGEPDREIITLALNGQLAIRAIDLATKLARLAAEMETDKHKVEHTWQDQLPPGFEPGQVQKQFAEIMAEAARQAQTEPPDNNDD